MIGVTTPEGSLPWILTQIASVFGMANLCSNAWEWTQDLVDDGMHQFTFLRRGSYHPQAHFWHADNGTNHHLKFQLLNEGMNRCATTTFRIVREVEI